ncbi:MAG: hypothetical protein H0T48_02615 [Gemmatimonadaceae bacterium]|nr:hypothetical protein [Gemmatimonadaceae bacterium]
MTNPVIDIHSHVFNAGYVPLEGIFRSRLEKEYHPLATIVARLLEGALERDESLPDSFFSLPGLRARLIGLDDEAAVDHFITAFVGAVASEYLDSHAADIEEGVTILRAADPSLSEMPDEETERLLMLSRGYLRARLRWLLKRLARLIEGGAALVSWILLLLGRESRLL